MSAPRGKQTKQTLPPINIIGDHVVAKPAALAGPSHCKIGADAASSR
jgi:hypothetical protein